MAAHGSRSLPGSSCQTLPASSQRTHRIVGSRVVQASADPSYRLYGAVSRSGAIRVIIVRGSHGRTAAVG